MAPLARTLDPTYIFIHISWNVAELVQVRSFEANMDHASAVAKSRNLDRGDYPEKHPPMVSQPMPPPPPDEYANEPLTRNEAGSSSGDSGDKRWTTNEFDGADECLPTFVMAWVS